MPQSGKGSQLFFCIKIDDLLFFPCILLMWMHIQGEKPEELDDG